MAHDFCRIAATLFGLGALCGSSIAQAQSYPSKPIRLIAPYPPGGGVDGASRIIAQALSDSLGQQVVVDNRAGASGRIGTELAAKSPADGYALLLGSVGPNAIIPGAAPKLPYSAADFAPISLVASSEYVLVVHPSLPVKTVKDLVAVAKANPGKINFASTGNLGGPHLAGELFNLLANVTLVHIAYKGGGPAATSILSGETALIFGSGPTVVPHVKSGRLRAIATTGLKRSQMISGLPTVNEVLPGHEVTQWYGVLAPAGTPKEIVAKLHAEIVTAVKSPKVREQFANIGADATSNTPEEFASYIKRETEKWGRVVKAAGVPLE